VLLINEAVQKAKTRLASFRKGFLPLRNKICRLAAGVVPSVVPWKERSAESSAGQPMALDTPAGEELSPADFFEVHLPAAPHP
jgi:hypothetical protein